MSKSKAVEAAPVEVEAAPVEVAATAKGSEQLVRAVYGRMVDPHTGLVYDVVPSELLKMTGWVQSQIDAGKLQLV